MPSTSRTSRSPPTRTCSAPETGQVLSDFQGKSVFDLNAERAGELRAAREATRAKRSDAELREEVRKLLGLGDRKIAAAKPRVVGTFSARGRTIRKLVFDVEPGIIVPALDIAAAGSDRPAPVVVKAGVDWVRDLAGTGRSTNC